MGAITRWRQREVIEEITAQVESDLEIAAKVVEVDARRRLLKIHDPEWGRGYRKLLALYRLTSFVQRSRGAVEAGIGIPPGKTGDLGFWIEVGSKTAAAHPWLRPALLTNLENIMALLGGSQ